MKTFNFFNKLKWLLVPLVLISLSVGNAYADTWTKVTSAPVSWAGEYLLVYENSSTSGSVWTGVDAASCYVSATISSGVISTKPDGAVSLIIAAMTGGYSIKVSGGTNNNKYIKGTSGSNALGFDASAQLNTITYATDCSDIVSNTSHIRWNTNRFRYYKSSTYTSSEKVQLYKKSASCDKKVTLAKGDQTNGTFSLDKSGAQTSCDGVTVTVTTSPNTGYYTSAVTESGASASPTITGSGNSWTVTYAANTTGTSTISVTFVEKTKYTVTWYVEGAALTGLATGLTSVYIGEKVSALPSPNPTSTCDGEFVGWIKAPAGVVDKTPGDDYETTPSTFNTQGTSPTITGNTDFYAVFKKRKE